MLSIIIPAYNAENTISRCLDSILTQKNCEYEIIVINDLSTDNTAKILLEYQSRNSQIKIINKTKKTAIADVRNYGIKEAKGDYITFVDSDDTIISDRFFYSECLKAINKYNSDALFFGYNIIRKNEIVPCPIAYNKEEGYCCEATKDIIHTSIACYHPYDVNGYIWKAIFRRSKLLIPIGYLSYEDMFFLHVFTEEHNKFLIYNKIGYNYYINENSFTHKKNEYNSAIKDYSSIFVQRIISNTFGNNKIVKKISKRITLNSSYFCYLHNKKTKNNSLSKSRLTEVINSIFRNTKKGIVINLLLDLSEYDDIYLATIYSIMAQRYLSYKLYIISKKNSYAYSYYINNLSFDDRIVVLDSLDSSIKNLIQIYPNMIFPYNLIYQLSKAITKGNPYTLYENSVDISDKRLIFPLLSTEDNKLDLKIISIN